jgi:sulfonate transport system ATP-binding protein
MSAIELAGVSKSYRTGRRIKHVVADCSMAIAENAFNVIIGPSGAGKSTLVRLIAGFERADSGRISMGGVPIDGPSKDRLVMFQETALFPWMTTRDNVLFGPSVRGLESVSAEPARQLSSRFGLSAFLDKYPAQLSGGMQRRAELARALLNEPRVMILDEPFRGLDAMTKALLLEYYAGVYEAAPRTNVFVTTDIDEAIFLADRLLVMSQAPTRLVEVFDVDLPRPRVLRTFASDPRARIIKERALAILREQALRAFADRSASLPRAAEGQPESG